MSYRTYYVCWILGFLTLFLLSFPTYIWFPISILALPLALIGVGMNELVKICNGGQMPAKVPNSALANAVHLHPMYCPVSDCTKLVFLADILHVKDESCDMMLSVGDLAIYAARGICLCGALHCLILMTTVLLK